MNINGRPAPTSLLADTSLWLDVRNYGAKCDATYDTTTGAITGTDDTAAFQAAIAAVPVDSFSFGGGVINIPTGRFCRVTSGLTITSPNTVIQSGQRHQHPNNRRPGSGIIFDNTSTTTSALTFDAAGGGIDAQGAYIHNVAILMRRASGAATRAAVRSKAGMLTLDGVWLSCIDANLDGNTPGTSDGYGLWVNGTQSGISFNESYAGGFYIGIETEACTGLNVIGSQLIFNNIHARIGSSASGGCITRFIGCKAIQDAITGNILIRRCAKTTIFGSYFEYGDAGAGGNPYNIRIGDDGAVAVVPLNISIRDNYMHGGDDTNAAAVAVWLQRCDRVTFTDNSIFASKVVIRNDATDVSNVTVRRNTFQDGPTTYVSDFTGVIEEDTTGVLKVRAGVDAAYLTNAAGVFPTQSSSTYLQAPLSDGTAGDTPVWSAITRSLDEQIQGAASVTTGETTLYSTSIAANTLAQVGDSIEAEFTPATVAHATATRRLKVKTGGTTNYDSQAVITPVAATGTLRYRATRLNSSTLRVTVRPTLSGFSHDKDVYGTDVTGLDFTAAITLVLTGQAGGAGAASGDITVDTGPVRFVPASDATHISVYHGLAEYYTGAAVTGYVNGNTLTLAGTTFAAGKVGNAFSFSGTGQTADAANHSTLQVAASQKFALGAWVQANSVSAAAIISKGWTDTNEYLLTIEGSVAKLYVNDGTTTRHATGATVLSTGVWYWIYGEYDGTNLNVYVNNVLDGTIAGGSGAHSAAGHLRIGSLSDGNYDMNGLIDEPFIVKGRILTSAERAYHYNSGSGIGLFPLTLLGGSATATLTAVVTAANSNFSLAAAGPSLNSVGL